MCMVDFPRAADETGMKVREGNKMLKKWPKRLFKTPSHQSAREEFDVLLASKTQGPSTCCRVG